MDFSNKPSPTEMLEHHGIIGMKWGVRRYQNEDGSLTPAGKKRYGVDIAGAKENIASAKKEKAKAEKAYNKATLGGLVYNQKASERLVRATNKVEWTKEKLASERVKEKLNSETKEKSKRRLKFEEEYRAKGMSEEEAAVAAYKRARTEKIIAVTAGVTLAAAATYVAYKHYDKNVDKIIKAGTELQNMSGNSNKGVADAFYFSMTKSDDTKYRGLYGSQIHYSGRTVYETKIRVNSAMKVASEKSAVKALSDLVGQDAAYRKTLEDHLTNSVGRYGSEKQNKVVRDGLDALKKGKINSKVYNALNLTLVDHDLSTSSTVNSGFYNKLKSLGYDAILDVNDKKYSGYMSSKPMIAFNAGSKASVDRVREVGLEEIQKNMKKGMMDITLKSMAPSAAGFAGSAGLIAAGQKAVHGRNNDAIVRKYRKEHPDTALSYDEILDNYYK